MSESYRNHVYVSGDRRRFSSEYTLTDARELCVIRRAPDQARTPPETVTDGPSFCKTLSDDINRRFYPVQFAQDEHAASDSEARTWHYSQHERISSPDIREICGRREPLYRKAPSAAKLPVGFFSPAIAKTRMNVLSAYIKTLCVLCVFVLMVLSLYWAVLIHVNQNLEALEIAVVSFDGRFAPFEGIEPVVGNALIKVTENAATLPNHLGFRTRIPSDFNDDPLEVRRWCNELRIWGAIIVNNNATALLSRAVETGDPNYDPVGAGQIIYVQARDLETINQYVAPVLIDIGKQLVSDFGTTWVGSVLTNKSLSPTIYSNSPQALNPAIGFSVFNLRPFDHPVAIPSVTIGLIYLIIIAFFSFGFFMPIHMKFAIPSSDIPTLTFSHLIIWRWTSTLFAYLCLSLSYSLVSLFFHIPFANAPADNSTTVLNDPNIFGSRTFAGYWMVNFIGMCALGLACENVAMLIGTPWVGLWLIFWVISNVATGFYALELAPSFFRWGYMWPLHSIVEASRTVLFDTNHMLGKDFLVLVGWTVLNSFCFPFACRFLRWKTTKE